MKYFIDFTTKNDIYNCEVMSVYFDSFEDYIFNLGTFKKNNDYKIINYGSSWGWDKEELANKVNDLIGGIE